MRDESKGALRLKSATFAVCGGLAAALLAAALAAPRAYAAGDAVTAGHKYFLQYCSSCHGADGSGDGPVAKVLSRRPANLRMLGDKYGMPLPAPRIAELIDGRDTPRAHGAQDMPVWGEQLYKQGASERGEMGIGEVIGDIIAYLDTIQDRRTAEVDPAIIGFDRYAIVFASSR